MRRNFYLGFGVVLIVIAVLFAALSHFLWFFGLLILLVLIAFHDINQKQHAILRNFPILGHIRYIFEFFRPEIQQYFIADDESERPFDRETRSIIYRRAKNVNDTIPFGTERDITRTGYEWVQHSLEPIPVDDVDSRVMVGSSQCSKPYNASRLNISAMSFGALSKNAIMALNMGAKIGNFAHNTGEGGLSHYHLQGGDIIWQIGTAYFGCRDADGNFDEGEFVKEATRDEVKMIEIKLSQGAKPSHGGILPADKLTTEIARIRKVAMGADVLSPPAHTAFEGPEGLMHFVARLRELSGGKPVGFKLCIGKRCEFLSICKAILSTGILPDFVTVDGAEGGTGAAPFAYTNYIGMPIDEGLSWVHNALVGIGVRNEVRVIASGKVATGFDMIKKVAIGADMCNSARAMMMAAGCIQSRQCNVNTCPTGVATQDPRLIRGLDVDDKKVRVAHFHDNTIENFKEILGAMGLCCGGQLNPHHVLRRIRADIIKHYDELFEYIKPKSLLGERIPKSFKAYWDAASEKQFSVH